MKTIIANWKMNNDLAETKRFCEVISQLHRGGDQEVIICPSFPYLYYLRLHLDSRIRLGAQNCSQYAKGAYTGEVSAAMLKDIGCSYVIVGHSERRAAYNETSQQIKEKVLQAHHCGLTAIICVGENLAENKAGRTIAVLTEQITQSLPETVTEQNTIIAYEPVWAIGSGRVPQSDEIEQIHLALRKNIGILFEKNLKIVYGGSVTGENCRKILSIKNVDGVLVGGASLNIDEFKVILEQI